jgi:hypothetical protein
MNTYLKYKATTHQIIRMELSDTFKMTCLESMLKRAGEELSIYWYSQIRQTVDDFCKAIIGGK